MGGIAAHEFNPPIHAACLFHNQMRNRVVWQVVCHEPGASRISMLAEKAP